MACPESHHLQLQLAFSDFIRNPSAQSNRKLIKIILFDYKKKNKELLLGDFYVKERREILYLEVSCMPFMAFLLLPSAHF